MFKIKSVYINLTNIPPLAKGTCNLYRIYKNPNAKDLFIKAQKAETAEEKERLFKEMGEYELVTESGRNISKNRFIQFLKGIFNAG